MKLSGESKTGNQITSEIQEILLELKGHTELPLEPPGETVRRSWNRVREEETNRWKDLMESF